MASAAARIVRGEGGSSHCKGGRGDKALDRCGGNRGKGGLGGVALLVGGVG